MRKDNPVLAQGRYKVIKSLGFATPQQEIDHLVQSAQQEIDQLSKPKCLFKSETDEMIRGVLPSLSNSNIQTVGPEGDFTSEEVKLASDAGFLPVHLGDSRLRTETAGVAACCSVYLAKI